MAKRTWADANGRGEATAPTPAPPNPSKAHNHGTRQAANRQSINGLGSGEVPIPQISRKIKACAACRKHKIKCLMDDAGPPCRRCSERGLGCVLGKSLQTIMDEKSQFSEAVVQDLEHVHGALKQVMNKLGLTELPPLQSSTTRDSEGSPPKDDAGITITHQVASLSDSHLTDQHLGPSCDNSPKATPEDEGLPYVPIHSLYTLTKLSALRSPEDNEAHRSRAIDDFIARGSISLSDAESLFTLYRDRLDPYMYGIGCRYPSLTELRRKSPILSAATLTVAALHDPAADGIYGVCSAEFRRLMEKSMFDRRIDRDYLRAMAVASYWLSDLSWMLSGYAIRRAAECNLHNSYSQAIREQSPEAADCARLWYILYVCDQHLATLYGRPSIVQEDSSIQGWEKFLASPVANEEDKRLTGQVALMSILRNIRELFGTDKGEPIPRVYLNHILQLRRELDQWYDRWKKEIPKNWPQIGTFPGKGVILHYNFAQIHLYSHIFRGLPASAPIPSYFLSSASSAISAATAIIELITTDADVAASLVGIPSYMHSMTAFACMFLIKVALRYDGLVERGRVRELIGKLVERFRGVRAGRWHLAGLMAGGLERMGERLGAVCAGEVTNGMAMGSGMADGGAVAQEVSLEQPFLELDGDLFFDYDMSFGLSPVFRFEPGVLNGDGLGSGMGFGEVDYGMRPTQ